MLIAHGREAAMNPSRIFQDPRIDKLYQIEVLGSILTRPESTIDLPLDGKTALTEYEASAYIPQTTPAGPSRRSKPAASTRAAAILNLSAIQSWAIRATEQATKNKNGLPLVADQLRFICPFTKRVVTFGLGGI